jgi:hypothetical protein
MPKRKAKKTKKRIPPEGRPLKEVQKDMQRLRKFSTDVPIGNTDPTVVRGKLYGGMPNHPARGGLRVQRGKRG